MNQTLAYYNKHAHDFCEATANSDMSFYHDKFMKYLTYGAHILDAGCGSGRDSKVFVDAGFRVTATDASEAMCAEAEKLLQQKVLCMSFEDITFQSEFDGIWACASLLHVTKSAMPHILSLLKHALKENGVLYASFKYGTEERVEQGRYFNDYDEQSLRELFEKEGFSVRELFITEDVRKDRAGERWVNVIAKSNRDGRSGARSGSLMNYVENNTNF